MASPSSTTEQSQGGTDISATTVLRPGQSQSKDTTRAYKKSSTTRARPDFTITFTLTPKSPPSGRPIV